MTTEQQERADAYQRQALALTRAMTVGDADVTRVILRGAEDPLELAFTLASLASWLWVEDSGPATLAEIDRALAALA